MELRIIENDEVFLSLRSSWNKIADKMIDATPFQSWEWNYYWWMENEHNSQLLILEAYINKEAYGYAPLIIKDNKICFIGDRHFDYGMFVCAERKREVFELFFEYIEKICKTNKYIIILQCIPQVSSQYSFFKEKAENSRNIVFREHVDTANITLQEHGSFEQYTKVLSHSLRKKSIKPCEKAGFSFTTVKFDENIWHDIERIYLDRQESRIGNTTIEWAKTIVKDLNENGLINIGVLKYEKRNVAFVIFFTYKGGYYSWLTAFEKVDNYALGHFMKYCLVQNGYLKNVNFIDLMRGAYAYKKQWDCNVSYNYEFIVFRNKAEEIFYLLKVKGKALAKRIVYESDWLKNIYEKYAK